MELDELKIGDGVYMQARITGINHDGVSEIGVHLDGDTAYLNVAPADLRDESVITADGRPGLGQICYVDAKIIDMDGEDITLEIELQGDSLEYVVKPRQIPTPEFVEDSLFNAKIVSAIEYTLGDFSEALECGDYDEKLEKLAGRTEDLAGDKDGRELIEMAADNFHHYLKYGLSDRMSDALANSCSEAVSEMEEKARNKPRM